MKHKTLHRNQFTALLAALIIGTGLVACDNQVNFSPTVPTFGDFDPQEDAMWTVRISGSLASDHGSCIKATILFDGQEIQGAKTRCEDPGGCSRLELSGVVNALEGHHTITFKVLRQSVEQDGYLASGFVELTRGDLDFGTGVLLNLEPIRDTLQQREGVTYEFDLRDTW